MRRPDFFIVGAPKCGTTALTQYLAEHPRIFVSVPKEPNYFARHVFVDGRKFPPHQASLEGYLELFRGAGAEHLVAGEASTRYLRSRRALRELHEFRPDARIIAMVRNPVDLAYSWHGQKLWEGQEVVTSFEKAWRLQDERINGRHVPSSLIAFDALFYSRVASVGTQLEFLLELFPSDQTLILFLDDLNGAPSRLYETVLRFLGVPSDGRTEFPVVRQGRRVRNPRLAALRRLRPDWAVRPARKLGLGKLVDRLVASPKPRAPLDPAFRRELTAHFEPEIRKIENLTGRDLSGWREAGP